MPGLSQLKKFNKDIISLGDEPNVRASRGERPVRVPIPKSIEDRDDTEDFVLGMPEIEAAVEENPVDDDLSEITGIGKSSSSSSSEAPAPSFEAPDLSNLLDLGAGGEASGGEMPDLSMFMEPVGEEEPEDIVEEEPEPEEISVADMGLDALLSGAGFDGSEGTGDTEEGAKKSYSSDEYYDFDELDAMDETSKSTPAPNKTSASTSSAFDDFDNFDDLEDLNDSVESSLGDTSDIDADVLNLGSSKGSGNLSTDDFGDIDDLGELDEVGDLDDLPSLDDASTESSGATASDDLEDFSGSELGDLSDLSDLPSLDEAGSDDNFTAPSLDDLLGGDDKTGTDDLAGGDELAGIDDLGDLGSTDDFSTNDLGDLGNLPSLDDAGSESEKSGGLDDIQDISSGDLGGTDELGDFGSTDDFSTNDLGDLTDLGDLPSLDDASTESSGATASDDIGDLSGLDDLPSLDDNSSDVAATDDNFSAPSLDDLLGGDDAFGTDDSAGTDAPAGGLDDLGDLGDIGDIPSLDDTATESSGTPASDDLGDIGDLPKLDDTSSDDSFAAPSFDDLLGDSSDVNPSDPFASSDDSSDPFGAIDSGDSADSFDVPDFSDSTDSDSLDSTDTTSSADSEDFASATPDGLFDSSDMELPDLDIPDGSGVDTDNLFTSEIPDYDDGLDSSDSMLDGEAVEGTLETFDTSDMDGDIDFGITDTDSALSGGNDFELGGADEFALEGSDFEIPGFSDVESIEEKKSTPVFGAKGRGRGKGGLDSPDFTGALESEKLPPNTLSDEQYKRFLKNLNEYPLNVRLAFEDFIVQDEFTDDAEFEVIEKILNKAPARQVASVLEKMLDISIPVPRDFEHRTAEEYEAYKKSIQYQLRNKIIPAMIVGVVAILVGWGLFNFGKFCIYIPAKAVSLYKQGYELIQKDEYPQSEQKFNEAVKYKLNKKWFFNYARAYREHKQYQRSSEMYTKILRNFKQDKQAGLEYADMMLNDLYNYERAEEILNREVLDYHINDADGRLLLGDTYLEWGTEKDPSKLDLAKEQYSILSQIYGANDLYNSRLMRYYVRTDNLLQVLNYKAIFEEREKSLSSQDCTEMSGYLLDKLYGPLSPSEEQLRTKIEGVKPLLIRAIKLDPDNAVGLYNLGKYYVNTNEISYVEATLKDSVKKFSQAEVLKKRDIYKFIDAYRLLGENYIKTGDTMKAQEQYTNGISLYTTERDNSGFAGNLDIGKLYADLANLNYFVSGDYDLAKENYKHSIELGNDSPAIRYRIGYVNYRNKNYQEALGSFMKAGEANRKEDNLLLAMANTLSLRDDDYSAEGYYEQLLARMDDEIADKQRVFPQTSARDYDIVNTYLKASNNYGVTLHRLAKRTGNSAKNAQAIVQFQHSLRAWDALTRNQETLVRLEGSNLAQENIKYITHMYSDYEPAIYIDIPRTLTDGEGL